MELVGVAAQLPDLIDAHVGKLQELGRPVHPVVHEKMLKGLPCALPEQFAQVISVQVAEGGDVLHRDGAAVILLDEGHGLHHVIILHPPRLAGLGRRGAADEVVEKQVQMPQLKDGGLAGVVDDGHELVPDQGGLLPLFQPIDRVVEAQAGHLQKLRGLHPVKLHPGVLPGQILIGVVGVHLVGADEKALAGLQAVEVGGAGGIVGAEVSLPREDEVEEKMVPLGGTVGVEGGTVLPSVLKDGQIDVFVALVDAEFVVFVHIPS